MADTEERKPIEFVSGHFRCKLVTQAYAELAGPVDATAADLIAALQANPELRAEVLNQILELPEAVQAHVDMTADLMRAQATIAELTDKLRAAEAELAQSEAAIDSYRDQRERFRAEAERLQDITTRAAAIVNGWQGRVPYPLREGVRELSELLASGAIGTAQPAPTPPVVQSPPQANAQRRTTCPERWSGEPCINCGARADEPCVSPTPPVETSPFPQVAQASAEPSGAGSGTCRVFTCDKDRVAGDYCLDHKVVGVRTRPYGKDDAAQASAEPRCPSCHYTAKQWLIRQRYQQCPDAWHQQDSSADSSRAALKGDEASAAAVAPGVEKTGRYVTHSEIPALVAREVARILGLATEGAFGLHHAGRAALKHAMLAALEQAEKGAGS